MNYGMFTGIVYSVPTVTLIPLAGRGQIFACKLVICSEDTDGENVKYDFFECLAFEDTAKSINDSFSKGSRINVMGKVKNFTFKDDNNTPHFTQIILIEHVDSGETIAFDKKDKVGKFPIVADLDEMDELFKEVCEQGFLCVDENDYFNIAANNISMIK
ncbi:MAG: single-stranded DNA-binding protein [Lachnospiraceae bacterium]|nr:single-stranded DNA-binding protein [Lachnospiraceae bacterium]